jgi:hypothetical protein
MFHGLYRVFDISNNWHSWLVGTEPTSSLASDRVILISVAHMGHLEWNFCLAVAFGNNDRQSNQQLPSLLQLHLAKLKYD